MTADVMQHVASNHGTMIGIQNINEIQRLRGTALTEPWIRDCLAYYVPDKDATTTLSGLLDRYRVAVIHGSAGIGRYSTALHTLDQHTVPMIRQVKRGIDEKVELEGLKDDKTGWILDLRHETKPLPMGFGLELREAEQHLRDTSSFLVVVIDTKTWSAVAGEASQIAHLLRPADPIAVARTYLERHNPPIGEADALLADGNIINLLQGTTPAKALEWARTIAAAVTLNRAAPEPRTLQQLVSLVTESARKWRPDLLAWHKKHTDSGHRNYLLAAAVLDEAPARRVYEAYTALGSALQDAPTPTHGQHGPGIIELTDLIGADLVDDDRVRFLKPGYTEAVVDYFWADRPHHVEAFTRWTADQTTTLPADLATRLADRVSQWTTRITLAKQDLTVLRATATHWAATEHLKGHAADLLVAAALHPVTGKLARDRYLTWAKAPDTPTAGKKLHTPAPLKRALAAAMAQLAPAYPEIALKRLATLASCTESPEVTQAVGDALMALWGQDTFEDSIRTRLTDWFTSSQPHKVQAACRTFLQIAERSNDDGLPVLLTPHAASWALTGWRHALDMPRPQVQAAIAVWLDAALAHPPLRPLVFDTFTDALFRAGSSRIYLPERFLALQHAAFAWEPAHSGPQPPTDRALLREELVQAMLRADPAVQPLEPSDALDP